MRILWLFPIAFAGLALTAIPIAIHLLVRQQSRRVAFPSLRFLRASRLAAVKRRTLQDLGLLVCRISIIAAAVAALASPIVITSARRSTYANRVARAIVVAPELGSGMSRDSPQPGRGGESPAVTAEQQSVYRAQVFTRAQVADAVADASRWLAVQAPSRRELVVVSPFPRGFITQSDLSAVPLGVGIRLVQTPHAESSRDLEFPILIRRNDALVVLNRRVHLDDGDTSARDGPARSVVSLPIRVIAAAPEQVLADAALAAVLDAGLRWPDPDRRIIVLWTGADERLAAGGPAGATVVKMAVPSPISTAASQLERALTKAIDAPTDALEPVRLTPEELSAWERAPAPPPDATPVDEGDRRWLWIAALVLIGLEQYRRRRPPVSGAATEIEEARVA